jgi:hypothetical protein
MVGRKPRRGAGIADLLHCRAGFEPRCLLVKARDLRAHYKAFGDKRFGFAVTAHITFRDREFWALNQGYLWGKLVSGKAQTRRDEVIELQHPCRAEVFAPPSSAAHAPRPPNAKRQTPISTTSFPAKYSVKNP